MLEKESLALLREALDTLDAGLERHLPTYAPAGDLARWLPVLLEVAERLQDNFPYPHPLYAGQMLAPPHPIARLAYALALWINPNNHALDGGRATSAMEKECVAELAAMFGWGVHLGHLTGGGTMANLEALWIAGLLAPGKKILASSQAHYTHERLSSVLKIPFEAVPVDARGKMRVDALEEALAAGDVGTVVVTIGTTPTGAVDPLPEVLALRERRPFRLHADAAYGGYFELAESLLPETRAAFERLREVDSIVVDPHKLGLQPYGCGCVLFRDPTVGKLYQHESPYTYFSSNELHLGEISLECSRAGASAAALWATHRLFPLAPGGELSAQLDARRAAALRLHATLAADPRWVAPLAPETNIVVWAPRAPTASAASALSKAVFAAAAAEGLHLATATLPRVLFEGAGLAWDRPDLVCLRSCLMKPEQLDWIDRIAGALDAAATRVLNR